MRKSQFTLLSLLCGAMVFAQEPPKKDSIQKTVFKFESSSVVQEKDLNKIAGSVTIKTKEDLEKYNYNSVDEILADVPGVNLYKEDGFGLRPNLSMRGTPPERSSKINLMEDGILISPAPYTAPSAYYFPTMGRMSGVEVLKGSSQILYGPNTSGGTLNLLSTPITDKDFEGQLTGTMGNYGSKSVHSWLSGNLIDGRISYMVEYNNYQADGFKELSNGDDTGFNKNDYVGKLRWSTLPTAAVVQSLEFKAQYSDEVSDETYLGLTDSDFADNAYQRYVASEEDQMNNDHQQYALTHKIKPSKNLEINTSAYLNKFTRNWYKLQKADGMGLSSVLSDPITNSNAYNVIRGLADGEVVLRNNNRSYESKGVQTNLTFNKATGNVDHLVNLGARYHYDNADRYQWEDTYATKAGQNELFLTEAGMPGTQANRIDNSGAFSAYLQYQLSFDNWIVTPGIRYENILHTRENFGDDLARAQAPETRSNRTEVFIPGITALYQWNPKFSTFVGVHKGFTPSGSSAQGRGVEESINYEWGGRYQSKKVFAEFVQFINDYDNLLGSDLNAAGGAGTGDTFNAGKAVAAGVEAVLGYTPRMNDWSFPMKATYTYTHTELKGNVDTDTWGEITQGDEIPYIPQHQLATEVGAQYKDFGIRLMGRFQSAMRTEAGQGEIAADQKINDFFVVNAAADYQLNKTLKLFTSVENLFDRTYAVSRSPYGLRPGAPVLWKVGITAKF